jgi:hypothetical protein
VRKIPVVGFRRERVGKSWMEVSPKEDGIWYLQSYIYKSPTLCNERCSPSAELQDQEKIIV